MLLIIVCSRLIWWCLSCQSRIYSSFRVFLVFCDIEKMYKKKSKFIFLQLKKNSWQILSSDFVSCSRYNRLSFCCHWTLIWWTLELQVCVNISSNWTFYHFITELKLWTSEMILRIWISILMEQCFKHIFSYLLQ